MAVGATLGEVVDHRALSIMPWRNLAFRCDSLQRGNLIASTLQCLHDLHEFINSSASCTIEHFAQYSRVAPRVRSRDTLFGQCKKIAINVDSQKPQPLRSAHWGTSRVYLSCAEMAWRQRLRQLP